MINNKEYKINKEGEEVKVNVDEIEEFVQSLESLYSDGKPLLVANIKKEFMDKIRIELKEVGMKIGLHLL